MLEGNGMSDFTLKLLLTLPLAMLLIEALLNAYCWSYCGVLSQSLFIQIFLLLLWSITVRWVLKTRRMPAPVAAFAFIVMYTSLVIDSTDPRLRTYLDNTLWAGAYAYLLRSHYINGKETLKRQELNFFDSTRYKGW
jgi:hypothetical protein